MARHPVVVILSLLVGAEVPIQIYRDGQVVNLNLKGGAIDVWGQYVRPKR